MTLDEIKAMWSKDCEIDDIELDKSSLDVPKLHAKYSDLLTDNILKLKGVQMKYQMMRKDKWLWFNGKMDESRVKELGWSDDPFDGLKILKTIQSQIQHMQKLDIKLFLDLLLLS